MRTPTESELNRLMHEYDPLAAHKYYEEHKHLKGRKKGSGPPPPSGRTPRQAAANAKAQQKTALAASIQNLQKKLGQLEELIRKKEHEAASEDRKSKAKKERSAKEKDKPKTAAEKAKAARDNKQYRDKHKASLKAKAKKDGKSGGGSDKQSASKKSVSDLKVLATRVKGQIAIAKAKLAAL
jgi:hypothetical protein